MRTPKYEWKVQYPIPCITIGMKNIRACHTKYQMIMKIDFHSLNFSESSSSISEMFSIQTILF